MQQPERRAPAALALITSSGQEGVDSHEGGSVQDGATLSSPEGAELQGGCLIVSGAPNGQVNTGQAGMRPDKSDRGDVK